MLSQNFVCLDPYQCPSVLVLVQLDNPHNMSRLSTTVTLNSTASWCMYLFTDFDLDFSIITV